MKLDNLRKSSNIEDRRGQSSSGSSYSSGSSGGNVLLGLLFSRLGWKGKLLVLILLLAFGGMSNLGGLLSPSTGTNSYQSSQVTTTGTNVSDADAEFMSKVLGSTEDFWAQEFEANDLTYSAPTMVFYTDQTQTGCGIGSAQAGPFYCSADRKIYIDTSFYQELSSKYKASGDFAISF